MEFQYKVINLKYLVLIGKIDYTYMIRYMYIMYLLVIHVTLGY